MQNAESVENVSIGSPDEKDFLHSFKEFFYFPLSNHSLTSQLSSPVSAPAINFSATSEPRNSINERYRCSNNPSSTPAERCRALLLLSFSILRPVLLGVAATGKTIWTRRQVQIPVGSQTTHAQSFIPIVRLLFIVRARLVQQNNSWDSVLTVTLTCVGSSRLLFRRVENLLRHGSYHVLLGQHTIV
jgi:hypothetical protein